MATLQNRLRLIRWVPWAAAVVLAGYGSYAALVRAWAIAAIFLLTGAVFLALGYWFPKVFVRLFPRFRCPRCQAVFSAAETSCPKCGFAG